MHSLGLLPDDSACMHYLSVLCLLDLQKMVVISTQAPREDSNSTTRTEMMGTKVESEGVVVAGILETAQMQSNIQSHIVSKSVTHSLAHDACQAYMNSTHLLQSQLTDSGCTPNCDWYVSAPILIISHLPPWRRAEHQ